MKPITFGSLFAGIGGFDLGFERIGMICKWQVEIDEYCNKVLAKHWPNVKRYQDVRECGKHNLEPVDLICGGFPCQPFSLAGLRNGKRDNRYLWPEMLRIIEEVRPAWIVGENVTGIKTSVVDEIETQMETRNYGVQSFIIPAVAFGAPHIRRRLFFVAHSSSIRCKTGSRLCKTIQKEIGGRRSAYGGSTITNRVEPCLGCGEDWCNWHNRHREDCGCPDPWDESDDPDIGWWGSEPNVGRVAYGVPHRMDRLKALGNAVVPQVAEFIGSLIVDVEILQ